MTRFIDGPTDLAPREAKYDQSRLALLEAHYAKRIESGKLQGASFLMARNGKVFAHKAMGRLTPEPDSASLQPDSIRMIASVTKTITATAIMKLVEDGRIWLEQPVSNLISEFDKPMFADIRIWHLLTHTSGLTADPGYFCEPYLVDDHALWGDEDWLTKMVLAGPVRCRPGEQWNYCSRGYAVLAEIVTRVSGKHFNDYVQDEIFRPIGMTRSFLEIPEPLWTEVCRAADWEEENIRHARDRKGAPKGGGGVFSTLHDLFKFGQCFLNGGEYGGTRILGKKTVQEMTRNQLTNVPAFHWGKNLKNHRQGLGWGFFCDGSTTGPSTYNHEGWGWCALFVDPVEQFVFVSFTPDAKDWDPELVVEPRTIAFSGIL
jgi:CubicO group peptidase (beta-lactamase class C family)